MFYITAKTPEMEKARFVKIDGFATFLTDSVENADSYEKEWQARSRVEWLEMIAKYARKPVQFEIVKA